MGVYDGVYQLDMSQADPNWAAMHKEMGAIDKKKLKPVEPNGK